MSYKVVELVHGTDPKILRPAMKRFVLSVLAAHANHDGSEVRPGLPRLAQRCGLSIDAVYRWRRLLRVEGWIVQVAREDRRRNRPAVYRIDLNKLQAAAWKGMAADSAPAQSQSSKSDSAPAPMKKGSDSALAPKSDSALAPKTLGSDSAPAQSNPSSPETRPKDDLSSEREKRPSPSPSESSTQAEGESEADREDEDGWSLNERLKVVLDEVGEDALNPTDLSIANTIRSRSKSGLKISPALMANFIGIFSKALAISNSKREAS